MSSTDLLLSDSRPLVLGGGMAGIAAAVRLADAGRTPVLIESRPYLGGRVRSFVHEPTGDEIDNGQHLMMGCYHTTFDLLDRLGTRSLVTLQCSLHVEFRDADGSRDTLTAPTFLPPPLNVVAAMLGLRRLSLRERALLARVALSAKRQGARTDESVREYLTRLGQSRRAQERLWDPIAIATLNTPPANASAALFVEVMRRAFLGGGDSSQLAYVRGGLSALIEPARRYIEERGGEVHTGAPIQRIERVGEEYVVHLKERPPMQSRHLIAALPSHALRATLDPTLARQILPTGELAQSPIVSLYLWYDRDPTTIPELCAVLGTNVQWVFNRRKMSPTRNDRYPGLLSCTISAAFEESRTAGDDVARIVETELRRAFPELAGARLIDALVVKEKLATFLATPGAERARPPARTAFPGLYLAGDWTRTGLPGTIEGAVQSGVEAAELALRG